VFERKINSLHAAPDGLARSRVNRERAELLPLDENAQGRFLERQDRISSGGADRSHVLSRVCGIGSVAAEPPAQGPAIHLRTLSAFSRRVTSNSSRML
jgi:hypothetical protein